MASASFMSKRSRILLPILALLLGSASLARAERTLTLEEALEQAHRSNRDLAQARARVAQAHTAVLQAWVALLPTVPVQGKYTHNYREVSFSFPKIPGAGLPDGPIVIQKGEQLDFALNVVVPLLVPFAYPLLQAAKHNEAAGRANQSVTEASVLYATAQAYYACAGADELVIARKHAVAVAEQALGNAKARLDAGVVNRVEVTRAELQLVRARQALVETEDTQASTYRALGTIMNQHEPVRVTATDEPQPRDEAVATLTESALKLRPEFTALEETLQGNRLTVSSGWWRWAPTVSAFGNLRAFNYAGFSGDNYSWAVGVQLDWTLYDGGLRDANRRLAAAQRWENEAKLDQLRDQARDDIYNAARTLHTKRQALDTAKRSLQLSKETLDLVQVQHDAGTATQLDLLQAQDNLVGAEVALAQARFDLALGALSLERLSGAFPDNRHLN